ncbi:hypothetical protein HEP74_03990 [Xanthomonas sp. SS]|nr:hypothetical protein HEP74_03990 [Xanthomonas sp. SS]
MTEVLLQERFQPRQAQRRTFRLRMPSGLKSLPQCTQPTGRKSLVGAASAATNEVGNCTGFGHCLSGLKPLLQCTRPARREPLVGAASAATNEVRNCTGSGHCLSGLKPLLQCTQPARREPLVGAASAATNEVGNCTGFGHCLSGLKPLLQGTSPLVASHCGSDFSRDGRSDRPATIGRCRSASHIAPSRFAAAGVATRRSAHLTPTADLAHAPAGTLSAIAQATGPTCGSAGRRTGRGSWSAPGSRDPGTACPCSPRPARRRCGRR